MKKTDAMEFIEFMFRYRRDHEGSEPNDFQIWKAARSPEWIKAKAQECHQTIIYQLNRGNRPDYQAIITRVFGGGPRSDGAVEIYSG